MFTNITLDPFSILSSDAVSSIVTGSPNKGLHVGSQALFGAAGGGHGGNSGQGKSQSIVGAAYGNFRLPTHQGSRGGKSVFPFTAESKGGGRLSLHAAHTLVIDGTLSAKGTYVIWAHHPICSL